MGRQGEENIFADFLRQVHELARPKLHLGGETGHAHRVRELRQAAHALQLQIRLHGAGGKEAAFGNADIERVTDRAQSPHERVMKIENVALLLPFQVERPPERDLVEMNFHNLRGGAKKGCGVRRFSRARPRGRISPARRRQRNLAQKPRPRHRAGQFPSRSGN